jgi:putative Mn2+ efflux pump MntP
MLDLIVISLGLGAGLAADAFSVSLTNGLAEPCGTKRRAAAIALVYALFQMAMPLLGWLLVSTMAHLFSVLNVYIPYVALALLLFIGGKMLLESLREMRAKRLHGPSVCDEDPCACPITAAKRASVATLMIQGVATSIDALSVGFTISDYSFPEALLSSGIIAVVTFALCFAGVLIGRKFGTKLAEKAGILGGVVLIAIGIKIFLDGIL